MLQRNDILISILLRIDDRRQSVICGILPCSVAILSTLTYYIHEMKVFFPVSDHIFDTMFSLDFQKIVIQNQFDHFYFLNMNISITVLVFNQTLFVYVLKVLLEGSISQIVFYLGLSFYFMSKNG